MERIFLSNLKSLAHQSKDLFISISSSACIAKQTEYNNIVPYTFTVL